MTAFWSEDGAPETELELSIRQAAVAPEPDGSYRLMLRTSRGDITGMLNICEGETGAVIFISGAMGGFIDGPADGVYARLASALVPAGVTSLRLEYRHPGEFDECLLDVLAAVSFLKGIGAERAVVVGHSFGGAVAIRATELSPFVTAVAAMSSQLFGTDGVGNISPRPVLLVHGMDDQVLEATASEILYERANEPKRLVLYAQAGHALAQCKDEVFALLREWIPLHAGARLDRAREE
jgi:pimeloyl-ACP methyl ester carboxylesterase